MQVRARLIDNGQLVFLSFHGAQTAKAAENELQRLFALPDYRPDLPELADLSGITSDDLDFNAMRRLARVANENTLENGNKKLIALYAPQDYVFGMARMFSTLCEMEPGHAQGSAFTTQAEALEWLGRSETRFEDIPGYDMVLR